MDGLKEGKGLENANETESQLDKDGIVSEGVSSIFERKKNRRPFSLCIPTPTEKARDRALLKLID